MTMADQRHKDDDRMRNLVPNLFDAFQQSLHERL